MRISQRSLVASVAVGLALFAYARVSTHAKQPAATRQAEAQTQTSQGELLDVDVKASSLTIQTPTAEMTFRYNDQTKVSGAQKGLSALATMTGSQVVVQFRKEGQMNVAMTIDVKAAK
jgi:hypothetical protein